MKWNDTLEDIAGDRIYDKEMELYDNCQLECCGTRRKEELERHAQMIEWASGVDGVSFEAV